MKTEEEVKAARREASRLWRLKNPEKHRENQRRFRLAHPEIIKERKAAYAKTEQGRANAKASGKRFRERHSDSERDRHYAYWGTPRGQASKYLVSARRNGGCTSTLDEAEVFFRNKPALCECCNKEPPNRLDHKHGGPIRGWTCHTCNISLGVIEREGFLEIALAYLNKTKA